MIRTIFKVWTIVLLMVIFTAGCGSDKTTNNPITSDEEQIKQSLAGWEATLEGENITSTLSYFSDNYLGDGSTKNDLQSLFQ